MKFWQPRWKLLDIWPQSFSAQNAKKAKKCLILLKNSKFSDLFLWTQKMQFWQPCRTIFDMKLKFFCSLYDHILKIEHFLKRVFWFKMFLWTRRILFWQPQRSSYGRRPRMVHSKTEIVKKVHNFFIKFIFFEIFLWKHRMQLWKPRRNIVDKNLKILAHSPNVIKNQRSSMRIFLFKIVFWTRRMQFWQPCWTLLDIKPCFSCPTSEHDKKNTNLSRSYELFPWTKGMQFRQHRRKRFNPWPKIFSSKSENDEKFFFRKFNLRSNLFPWTRRMQLWNLLRKLVDKSLKICSSKSECDKETIFLPKSFFL